MASRVEDGSEAPGKDRKVPGIQIHILAGRFKREIHGPFGRTCVYHLDSFVYKGIVTVICAFADFHLC